MLINTNGGNISYYLIGGAFMISYSYDFDEFIRYVAEKNSVIEIIAIAHHEANDAERLIQGGRRGAPRERERGCPQYARLLSGFIFFLGNGVKPSGVSDYDFPRFLPVVRHLVEIGQLRPDTLRLFGERDM